MNLLFLLTLALPILLIGMLMLYRLVRPTCRVEFANIAEGSVAGKKTYAADAALAIRFVAVKLGSDANHVAVAGTADIAIGICTDNAEAAEDLVNVALLGSASETLKVTASAAIAAGDFVVTAANGKVRTLPATTGTYYIIGRALQAAAADLDVIEIDPMPTIQRVVP